MTGPIINLKNRKKIVPCLVLTEHQVLSKFFHYVYGNLFIYFVSLSMYLISLSQSFTPSVIRMKM